LRGPLVLRHYLRRTYPQISEILGVPETTVKSRILKALQELRDQLTPQEERAPQRAGDA